MKLQMIQKNYAIGHASKMYIGLQSEELQAQYDEIWRKIYERQKLTLKLGF
jgi:hypothetical protein